MAALAPDLERLRAQYASDPMRYWQEVGSVMRAHGVRPADPAALIGMLIQAPILFGVFAAVRKGLGNGVPFLWITDLAKRDLRLALVVVVLTGLSMIGAPGTSPNPGQARIMIAIAFVGTGLFLWSTASSVALSVGAGAAVSLLQNWLIARGVRSAA